MFAAHAETWIDVPFRWQGCVRAGCDCKGLLTGVAAELDFPEAQSLEALAGDYGHVVPVARLRTGLARIFDRVEDRLRGDVLLVKTGGLAQHLAICAPRQNLPWRVIEAMHENVLRVRPFRREPAQVDSVWRWKAIDGGNG